MIDVVTFAVFFIFGLYLAGRLYFKRIKAVSNVPWWVGDPVHGAVGMFVTRLPVEWAWLISVLYVAYQLLDWRVNGSDPVKDIGVYMGGMIIGFGYDMVKF